MGAYLRFCPLAYIFFSPDPRAQGVYLSHHSFDRLTVLFVSFPRVGRVAPEHRARQARLRLHPAHHQEHGAALSPQTAAHQHGAAPGGHVHPCNTPALTRIHT